MSVSVNTTTNNNNNNGLLYTASAAGGASLLAGAAGYLSKPYLKDGNLPDEFVREVFKDAKCEGPATIIGHSLQPKPNGVKAYYTDCIINKITPENLKKAQQNGGCTFKVGLENVAFPVNEKTTVEQLKKDVKLCLEDSKFIDWDMIAKDDATLRKSYIDVQKKRYWDSAKKQFKKLSDNADDCDKAVLAELKSLANKECLKMAGIWAGVAAVTAGAIGGLILACSKSKPEPEQKQVNLKS